MNQHPAAEHLFLHNLPSDITGRLSCNKQVNNLSSTIEFCCLFICKINSKWTRGTNIMSLKHQEGPPESPRAADDFLKCPFFVCGKHSDVKKKRRILTSEKHKLFVYSTWRRSKHELVAVRARDGLQLECVSCWVTSSDWICSLRDDARWWCHQLVWFFMWDLLVRTEAALRHMLYISVYPICAFYNFQAKVHRARLLHHNDCTHIF